jgi:hypothetical protein
MKFTIAMFILAAALIIILGHLGLFVSWVKFFSITSIRGKTILGVILAILSVSFLLTSLLVYWHETWLTNSLYIAASTWLGFVLYAGIAVIATWMLIAIAKALGITLPRALIAGILIAAAACYTGYGVWNAWHPTVKRISVKIKNLPDAWKGKTIVQLSDVHLGPVHRKSFLKKVVAQVNAVQPEAVFVTGDLFDGGGRDLNSLASPLNDMKIAQGSFFITGNHETYVGLQKSLSALHGINITILRDQIVSLNGLNVIGADYPAAGAKKDIAPLLSQVNSDQPSILLYHEPVFIDEAKNAGVDLQLAGHTHKGQLWPFGWITKKVFKGYDYGLHVEGSYNEYTSSGVGTWGPPIRTGNQPEIVAITLE